MTESAPIVDTKVSKEEQKTKTTSRVDKKAKIERERSALLSHLASGNFNRLNARVAYVLNHFKATRNSDVTLQLKYWEIFQPALYSQGESVDPKELFQLERLTSIARARAKIQNEYGLFQSEEKVRRYRRELQAQEMEAQLADKPVMPPIIVSCDESGKDDEYMVVGSLWNIGQDMEVDLRRKISSWKNENGITFEFHFTKMSNGFLDKYKGFFDLVLANSSMLGFKAVVLKKSETRRRTIDELMGELHYQLVNCGLNHEITSGRVVLPRELNFIKDEESSNDKVMLLRLEEHLTSQFKLHYNDQLQMSVFTAIPSKFSPEVQIADLFTGSVSRILNSPDQHSHKDEFAQYVLKALGLDLTSKQTVSSDIGYVHFL